MTEFDGWIEQQAAEAIEETDYALYRAAKMLLKMGQTPQEIMWEMRKRFIGPVLGLLELALEYWKESQE